MAIKDTFYFSHDSNAHDDPRLIKLRRIHGWAGYGCYWLVIELLRDQSDYELRLSMIPDLEYNNRIDDNLMGMVVNNFELFIVENDVFYSARLKRSMQIFNDSRKKRSEAGKKGNDIRWSQSQSDEHLSQSDNGEITSQSQSDEHLSQVKGNKGESNQLNKKNGDENKKNIVPTILNNILLLFKDRTDWDADKCAKKAQKFYEKYDGNWAKINIEKTVDYWIESEFTKNSSVWNKEAYYKADPNSGMAMVRAAIAAGYTAVKDQGGNIIDMRSPAIQLIKNQVGNEKTSQKYLLPQPVIPQITSYNEQS